MNDVSIICKKEIDNLNKLLNVALTEIKVAKSRAKTAEDMLCKIKNSASSEIQKAYMLGYKNAKKEIDDNSGGRENEDFKKLVLTND